MRSLEVEEHLRDCATCGKEAAALRALRSAIGDAVHVYTIPPGLEARVRAMGSAKTSRSDRVLRLTTFGWGLTAAVAAVVLVAIWFKVVPFAPPDSIEVVTGEVLADHVRSLIV